MYYAHDAGVVQDNCCILLHLDTRRLPTLAACHLKTLSTYPGGPQRRPEPTPQIDRCRPVG